MNLKSISECEQRSLTKIISYRLPNKFKKIGWIVFALTFIVLFSTKLFDGDFEILVELLKKLLLVCLLVVVLSKEKIEDEMIKSIRAQSFSFAFIGGVLFTLIQPLINLIVSFILRSDNVIFEDLGDFQVLWFMLIIYLVVFNKLKKKA